MNPPGHLQWEFGPFRLDGSRHLLFRRGELVPLSRKAVDLLVVLLESHGQLVEKEVLMRRVWPDSFVEESNLAVHISQLRKILGDEGDASRIETIPRRGYRFLGDVRTLDAPLPVPAAAQPSPPPVAAAPPAPTHPMPQPAAAPARPPLTRSRQSAFAIAALAAILVGAAFLVLRFEQKRKSAPVVAAVPLQTDSIVLADIVNNTADPVFNTTLRQAIAVELEQSPYLRLVPESRIQQTLRLMGKPADTPLTADVSRELCQRNDSEAYLDGSIAKLGSQYVLGVQAVNCRSGEPVVNLQSTAPGKEEVLPALGDMTAKLRAKLGESLATVQRFNTPIEDATTPSLEALQAYSIGRATMIQKGESSSCIPFFQRAIQLDPDFAMAWAALGNAYNNLGETGLAADNTRRAYELREHTSERERLYIEGHFYEFVTGDLTKAAATYQTWAATYPDDVAPHTNLAVIDSDLGQFAASRQEAQAALRLGPDDEQNYANLVNEYMSEGRLTAAHALLDQAFSRHMDASDLHLYVFDLAFLEHNQDAIDRQMTWAAGEPGIEDLFLDHDADVFAWYGQLAKARDYTQRATAAARRAGEKETAAGYLIEAAQREALYGNLPEARRLAAESLTLAHDRDTQYGAALALALAGSAPQAGAIADQLNRDFPDDTFVQYLYLPAIRAAVALQQHDPSRAIALLDTALPYEAGEAAGLFPAYLRGLAFLASGDGHRARIEFDKLMVGRGVVLMSPIGALASLDLARACQIQNQPAEAKTAYRDFFTLWQNADPGIPILAAAKSESANL
ncbi:MAG TPA: winged helix-turn-helix domain-containing protein [Acidobacteriaceae bacterium]|nr:winged helix-turn-helix domain-containing protein [Acidobacteriaceae bacterium]